MTGFRSFEAFASTRFGAKVSYIDKSSMDKNVLEYSSHWAANEKPDWHMSKVISSHANLRSFDVQLKIGIFLSTLRIKRL